VGRDEDGGGGGGRLGRPAAYVRIRSAVGGRVCVWRGEGESRRLRSAARGSIVVVVALLFNQLMMDCLMVHRVGCGSHR
jgi:hypothetical protein